MLESLGLNPVSAGLIWSVFGVAAGVVAGEKGRSFGGWLLLGLLLGPFALLWIILAAPVIPDDEARDCPYCGGRIRRDADKCRHCDRRLTDGSDVATRVGREAAGAAFLLRRALGRARKSGAKPADGGDSPAGQSPGGT